jgi:hypothetical protein
MKTSARVLLSALMMLAAMFLVNCGGSYGCNVTFGNSSCTPSGSGITSGGGGTGGSGGGGSSNTAYVFQIDTLGTVDGYTLNSSAGTLAETSGYTGPAIPTNSGGVGMVVAQEQFLYAGFGITDQIFGWTISSGGLLKTISGSPFSAPYLSNIGVAAEADMITNPAGTLLFVSDPTQNEIYVYTIGTGGVLAAVTGSPFAVPFPPLNLAIDGLGKYLYAVDDNTAAHTGSEIAAFSIASGGVLTAVAGSPFTGTNYSMWLLKGEPTGQFMIGTSGNSVAYSGVDDDNLYVFNITPSGTSAGALTQVAVVPTNYSPFSIAVQSNTGGDLVYSFSFNDTATGFNAVEGYTISSSGTLIRDTGSPFSGVGDGSWGQFDQSGDLLFVYSSYVNPSTSLLQTQLAPLDVASGGALTQPVSTLTLPTAGFWVITDPN